MSASLDRWRIVGDTESMSITVRLWNDTELAKVGTDPWLLTLLANKKSFSGSEIRALQPHSELLKTYVCQFEPQGEDDEPFSVEVQAPSPVELKLFLEAEYSGVPDSVFQKKTDFIPVRLDSYKLDRKIIFEHQIEYNCRIYSLHTGETIQQEPCDCHGNPLWSLDTWLETFTEANWWDSNAIPTNIDEVLKILTDLLEQMGFEVGHVDDGRWQIELEHHSEMPYTVASNMLTEIKGYLPAEGVPAF